jgi:hypothetical protein
MKKLNDMNKHAWNKLADDFNKHAEQDDWKKERSIKIEHTSLFPSHNVGRGPNVGENTLLDFTTKLTEASAVHFHYERKYGFVEILVKAKDDSDDRTFFEVRKNNKNYDFTYKHRADADDQFSWLVKDLIKAIEEKKNYVDTDSIEAELKTQGYSIVCIFPYTNIISFSMPHHGMGNIIKPSYVKKIKSGIELGFISSGTYNAIPNVIRITKARGIKAVSLKDLGLETRGYHDHHYRCNIQPSQAKQAQRFFKSRFKNNLKAV